MHQVLFRGKRKDTGEWVYGYYARAADYLTQKSIDVIFPQDLTLYPRSEFSEYYEIIPETLGRLIVHPCYGHEMTCRKEKFFEGDIVGIYHRHADIINTKPDRVAIVVDESCITENGLGYCFPQDTIETKVLGNVYDNPELVGTKEAELYQFYNGFNIAEWWINECGGYLCSNCGCFHDDYFGDELPDHCPKCNSKMFKSESMIVSKHYRLTLTFIDYYLDDNRHPQWLLDLRNKYGK